MFFITKVSIMFLLLTICCAEKTIDVDTSVGVIKGMQMETRLGVQFWSFRGIRYAKPPIGELRFQDPQPIKAWKPIKLDATQDGPMCPQVTKNRNWLSEDCLRLNIYTKDLNITNDLKPVVVYLHPGGFYFGSAISAYAGPQHFMDRDIVLVTVNYRLGSLGFMATGTADSTGNMGLKDQVIALRWIQTHILHFGGDANSVTLWGYSSGSRSVGLHMLSPMTKGLFHRAIMQSATPLAQFHYQGNQTNLAEKQAKLLKCPTNPIKDMIKCLKSKPMLEFVDTTAAMFELDWSPVINWRPVVEPDFGQERFIVEDPYKTMMNGNINKVPLIIGVTQYEYYYVAYYTIRNNTKRQQLNQNFEKYTPIYFNYERDSPKSQDISQALHSFYFQNESIQYPQSLVAFGELYSDGVSGFAYHRFLQMISEHVPVYTYLFSYKGRYSHFKNPDTNQTYGAMHHDELLYLLHKSPLTPIFSRSDPENDIIERLTRLWYEFAKNGDPNNPNDGYLRNLKWPLYNGEKKQYLEIGDELNVKLNGIYTERLQFWDRLFPVKDFLIPK